MSITTCAVKSQIYSYGLGLVKIDYLSDKLVGVKLTGSKFVPSGKSSFMVDMESQQVGDSCSWQDDWSGAAGDGQARW